MGLCLCVFQPADGEDDEPEELAACDVGHYSDFGCFRDTIARHLGASRFPTLMEHSDCDGEWTVEDIPKLQKELREIAAAFEKLPPETPANAFEHTAEYRAGAQSLYECFHDVNGDNLFESMLGLCQVALENELPITFM
jgi:Immunity protein 70